MCLPKNNRNMSTSISVFSRWARASRSGAWCGVRALAFAAPLAAGLLTARAQAPQLTSTDPANGATGVAVTSEIVFTFSRAMDDRISPFPSIGAFVVGNLDFTPKDAVQVDGTWAEGGLVLTCTPMDDLPPSTTITWKLNPAGSVLPFTSADGVPLATVSGSFTTGTSGGGGGGTAPELVSVSPGQGSTGIPVTAVVSFVFDLAMQKDPAAAEAVTWFGNGLDPAKFTCSWSADGKTLTCDYAGDLPAQTMVFWNLNGDSSSVLLQSEAGEALAETGGIFTTGQSGGGDDDCEPDGVPVNWGGYSLLKQGDYQQTSSADPVPAAEEPFMFGAVVLGPEAGPAATAGSVTLPGGTKKDLQPAGLGNFLMVTESPATEAALEAAYPAGNYVLRFTLTGQAERAVTMSFPASNPPVPKNTNFDAAQAVNAGQDFTLQWNSFTGAAGLDAIGLVVTGTNNFMPAIVFRAPDLCVPRPLAPTATSIVIPANTFKSNQTYTASLSFSRVGYFSTNSVPEMAGYSAVSRTTQFTIKTGTGGGGPATAARFTAYRLLPNGNPELTLTGTAGHSYTILRTANLLPANWVTASVVMMDAAGRAVFEDVTSGKVLPLFYRALAN